MIARFYDRSRMAFIILFIGGSMLWLRLALTAHGQDQTLDELSVFVAEPVDPIDSNNPQVHLTLTVLAPEDQPFVDLAVVQVTEAGRDIPNPQFTSATDLPLSLVLALDLSYDSQADWQRAIAAAQSLIDSLSPNDRLTIVRFSNDVKDNDPQPVDLKNPPTLAADQAYSWNGDRTAFYQAVQRAVALTKPDDPAWAGRQSVVVITNIGDNTQSPAAATAKLALTGNELPAVPVHIISFSPKAGARQSELREIPALTRGTFEFVEANQDLSSPTSDLVQGLRSGYRVSFKPPIGESAEHTAQLTVIDTSGRQGISPFNYRYMPRDSWLVLQEVSDLYLWQTLVLTAEVQMPYPAAYVEYQLGSQRYVRSDPPYFFSWPANELGAYSVSVTAVDEQGNRSNPIERTFQVVPWPDGSQVISVYLGEPVQLIIDSPMPGATVNFYLDDDLLDTVSTNPYSFELRPEDEAYPDRQGITQMKATVRKDGRLLVERIFQVRFLNPPVAPNWWSLIWRPVTSGLLLAIASFVLLPVLLAVWRDNYRLDLIRCRHDCFFGLTNLGNVASRFQLQAVAVKPPDSLEFKISQLSPVTVDRDIGPDTDLAESTPAAPTHTTTSVIPQTTAIPNNRPAQDLAQSSNQPTASQLAQAAGVGGKVWDEAMLWPGFRRLFQPVLMWQHQGRMWSRWTASWSQGWSRLSRRFWPPAEATSLVTVGQRFTESEEVPTAPSSTPPEPQALPKATGEAEPDVLLETEWQRTPLLKTGLVKPGQQIDLRLAVRRAAWLYDTELFIFQVLSEPADTKLMKLVHERQLPLPQSAWIYRRANILIPSLVFLVVAADLLWVWTVLIGILAR